MKRRNLRFLADSKQKSTPTATHFGVFLAEVVRTDENRTAPLEEWKASAEGVSALRPVQSICCGTNAQPVCGKLS